MIQNESNVTLSSENISFKHAKLIVLTAVVSYLRQPYEILRDGGVSLWPSLVERTPPLKAWSNPTASYRVCTARCRGRVA